ncbi:MAG: hypothetical protein HYV24_03355 [Deltaproteobacteria bacterium]|nr:hypothetical protein [Deltaproteobacteria bacterium]
MYYKHAKFAHLLGLILWIGPSTGGYLLFLLARYQKNDAVVLWLLDRFINLVHLEAAGLLILIASGFFMRSAVPELRYARWLKRKLAIVFAVFVPFELANLYIYDFIIKKAFSTGVGIAEAMLLYDKFSIISALVLLITIPFVFWLAIFRPGEIVGD